MRPLEEKSTMTEHEKKYDKIAQRIGRVCTLKHVAKFYLVATLLFLGGCGADTFDCNDCYEQDYYEAHTYECEECLLEMLERGEE